MKKGYAACRCLDANIFYGVKKGQLLCADIYNLACSYYIKK